MEEEIRNETGMVSLDNHFLAAMPGMGDPRFERSVVYVCAHTPDGAMGFIINRALDLSVFDLLAQLGVVSRDRPGAAPEALKSGTVHSGGPVDTRRGFVIHSGEVTVGSSMPISDTLSMTATTDILKAIGEGDGPERFFLALGYTGWGAGQLESEFRDNVWLSSPADEDLIFDTDLATKYNRVLVAMGVNPAMLSAESGRA